MIYDINAAYRNSLSELCIHVTAVNKYNKISNFDHSQRRNVRYIVAVLMNTSFQEKNSVLILPTFVGGTFKLCASDKILVISSLTGKIVQKVWDKEE